jgi:kanamycin kinase
MSGRRDMPLPCDRLTGMSWQPVTTGRSGAVVSKGPGVFRKQTLDPKEDLRNEAERLVWLPEVLDADRTFLLTREVAGRTAADDWPTESRPRVVDALARVTRDVHALPLEDCPFDRRLDVSIPEAMEAQVDLTDLDPERRGWSRERLVAELLSHRPEQEDLAVCHGDLCLPNILVDPDSFAVTGVIDTGRLGIADRWTDLAIATRSLASPQNPQFGEWAARQYLTACGLSLDIQKRDYYRLLDEFF